MARRKPAATPQDPQEYAKARADRPQAAAEAEPSPRTTRDPTSAGNPPKTGGAGARALVARAPKAQGGEVTILGQGRALIESLAAAGFTDATIAARLGVSGSTLREVRKRDEQVAEALTRGRARLEDELVHRLLGAGRKGNITALIFLGKARFGWRDQGPVDGGGDTKVAVQIVLPGPMAMADYERMVDAAPALPPPQASKEAR